MDERKKILVLGIGNLILKDEGIGIHVIERLKNLPLPPDVEVIDGGVLSYKLMYIIEGRKKVIVINTMKADGPPGTIYRFTDADIEKIRGDKKLTIQEFEFLDELGMSKFIKKNPDEIVFIGIEPEDTGEKGLMLESGLSPTLEKKIPEIIDMVMREIKTDNNG